MWEDFNVDLLFLLNKTVVTVLNFSHHGSLDTVASFMIVVEAVENKAKAIFSLETLVFQ